MRPIFLSLIIVIIGCAASTKSEKVNTKLTLYVLNDETMRPGQTLEDEFWETKHGLDTIEIKGEKLIQLYSKQLLSLKDTLLYQPGEIDQFPHAYAFILTKGSVIDTFYSNRSLYLFKWKNRSKYYTDPTGFFEKHFSSFLIN
jgi:hypothetical protein